TFLLNQFIRLAKHEGKFVSVTATTGLAATHIGGTTIHAWSGIGIHDQLPSGFAEHISKGRREIIEKTDILIIDEVSMLHDYRLDMVDEVCRLVRKRVDEPFGGIQVVMSGDFFQLPPINRPNDRRQGSFVVNSLAWRELQPTIIYLRDQYRQQDDDLQDILESIRRGEVRRHHAEKLLERIAEVEADDTDMTELHTTNIDVDRINQRKLDELYEDAIEYQAVTTGSANYVENLMRSVLAPELLLLKKGALVMAVRNDPSRKFVNGSIGKVVAFEPGTEYPIVEFLNGKEVTMTPESWELRDGDKKRAGFTQIPLRLAWAITVHKSQGMTLDAARIDLRRAFVEGMGYVALSRVKNLQNLHLMGINKMALKISEEALSIDELLVVEAEKAAEKFAHLAKQASERDLSAELAKAQKKTGSSSGWAEKIAKMREIYPNAYKPWLKNDDETLKTDFQNGRTVKELSQKLGRHEGSIAMRLQKHFGEDVAL
nr:AAA family ATPase [Candidatus Saccharibacteria bacterium]